MVFLVCNNNEYVNVLQVTSIHPYVNNLEYSMIHTSDGREYLYHMKTKELIDRIKEIA